MGESVGGPSEGHEEVNWAIVSVSDDVLWYDIVDPLCLLFSFAARGSENASARCDLVSLYAVFYYRARLREPS